MRVQREGSPLTLCGSPPTNTCCPPTPQLLWIYSHFFSFHSFLCESVCCRTWLMLSGSRRHENHNCESKTEREALCHLKSTLAACWMPQFAFLQGSKSGWLQNKLNKYSNVPDWLRSGRHVLPKGGQLKPRSSSECLKSVQVKSILCINDQKLKGKHIFFKERFPGNIAGG